MSEKSTPQARDRRGLLIGVVRFERPTTCTPYLVAGGADVKSVQKRLGHSSVQTTLSVYSHVLSRSDADLAATVDAAFPIGATSS